MSTGLSDSDMQTIFIAHAACVVLAVLEAELLRRRLSPQVSGKRVATALLLGAASVVGLRAAYAWARGDSLSFGLPDPASVVLFEPMAEELVKGLAAAAVVAMQKNVARGLALGASVGAGFAALENEFFLTQVPTIELFRTVALERISFSPLVHGCATGLVGAALASRRAPLIAGSFITAVAFHGATNSTVLLPMREYSIWVDLGIHIAIVLAAITVFTWGFRQRGSQEAAVQRW